MPPPGFSSSVGHYLHQNVSSFPQLYQQESGVNEDLARHTKKAIIDAPEQDSFITLPLPLVFPVAYRNKKKSSSRLLVRSFHREMISIVEYANQLKLEGLNFYGPPGIGKSWSAMYLLRYLLKENEQTNDKKNIIYYDSAGAYAWVFGIERCVLLDGVFQLNTSFVPELNLENSIVIYDVVAGVQNSVVSYSASYFVFASPDAGEKLQISREKQLVRINCPNWTLIELKMLGQYFASIDERHLSPEIIEERYKHYGGSARLVTNMVADFSEDTVNEAILNYDTSVDLITGTTKKCPITLLQSISCGFDDFPADVEATFWKYRDANISWDFASPYFKEKIQQRYIAADKKKKDELTNWLAHEPKAAALVGYFFENEVLDFFKSTNYWERVTIQSLLPNIGTPQANSDYPSWEIPKFITNTEVIHGNNTNMNILSSLTDTQTLYKLPPRFPLIDYFNPPNNCFSLGVGHHTIHLGHALELCELLQSENRINFVYITTIQNSEKNGYWQSFDNCHAFNTPTNMIYRNNQNIFKRLSEEHKNIMRNFSQYRMVIPYLSTNSST